MYVQSCFANLELLLFQRSRCRRRSGNTLITELSQHYTNSHTHFVMASVNHMLLYSLNLPRTKSGDSTAAGHQLLLLPLHLPLGQLKNASFSDNATTYRERVGS